MLYTAEDCPLFQKRSDALVLNYVATYKEHPFGGGGLPAVPSCSFHAVENHRTCWAVRVKVNIDVQLGYNVRHVATSHPVAGNMDSMQ